MLQEHVIAYLRQAGEAFCPSPFSVRLVCVYSGERMTFFMSKEWENQ
ncbi:hypothetical protein G5B30_00945 [Sphingobacterium sp. SGG-5]|nr:hypothetical protein [Sphingobacterium sp. SGG-5]NGM60471.1 hypothetical protein [Sphingobacterium sp. SGG-5]